MMSRHLVLLAWFAAVMPGGVAQAASPASSEALVDNLRAGGHVLVMRHAHSPRQPPSAAAASPGNTGPERELDEAGREAARAMGEALARLGIRITSALSSPTFRAQQTVRAAGLGEPQAAPELGDRSGEAGAAWLRAAAAKVPAGGGNTLLVTHAPNVMAAFAAAGQGMEDGEALVIRPDGAGGFAVLGRIRIAQWPVFAGR